MVSEILITADAVAGEKGLYPCGSGTDILQYRLRFGFSLLYKTVFHLNSLTAQLSYEGRAAVEGGK
jgi:hypothetical protein